MASCPNCGAEITHAKTRDGENIPLEKFTESGPSKGPRFRVAEFGPPLIVEPVSPASPVSAYPDHRKDCPAHGNGH